MNKCPSCKRQIAELRMSIINARDPALPAIECATLCCPHCGSIIMVMPDMGSVTRNLGGFASGH